AEAPPEAERIFLSWESGRQDRMNALLADSARAGKTVVRLKGGDPFLFGRGGEEALYLAERGIPFEVVPGVTAAVAVPAYAGIPVTHRGITSTLTAVTGHEDPSKPESALNWTAFARGIGTLIFFMGAKNLPNIVEQLVRHGRPPETPVALIQWGTTPRQRTLTGTLADIVEAAHAAVFSPPILIVVGEVVRLREQLAWFEKKPLFGRRVLVTRSRDQAGELSAHLAALGAETVEAPLIRFETPKDSAALDLFIDEAMDFDWLVFTSAHAVDRWFERIRARAKDARSLAGVRIAAVGPGTAKTLERYGVLADYRPDTFRAETLAEGMAKWFDLGGAKVLFPCSDIASDTVCEGLTAHGAHVTRVTAYRTVPETALPSVVSDMLEKKEIDVITFASSSAVRAFVQIVGPARLPALMESTAVACMGPVTLATALDAGLDVAILPDEVSIPAFAAAIAAYCS
ncbi:MAG: uroporphyrinogen-III C-methyltransferase, partial [candidate division Zixibacteria bacterium]|nr:uroporphyrinogen-III C-methyltransferase [candidate division Zixibacteria bacterium]